MDEEIFTANINLTSPYIYLPSFLIDKITYYYNGIFCRTVSHNISKILCKNLEPYVNGISLRLLKSDYF